MVESEAKLLIGKDAYIVHHLGKPFPNDFSEIFPTEERRLMGR